MRIGFYHESAGTRHAGGIAVYTQHVAAELAKRHDVYVYTQAGDTAELLGRSDAEVVETPSFGERIPNGVTRFLPVNTQDLEKIAMTVWSRHSGLVDHIEEHTDVVFTFQFLDDLLLSNLVDVPTVYGFHSLASVGLGARLRERFSQTDLIVANSHDTARQVSDEFGYEVDDVVYPGVDVDRFRPDAPPAFSSEVPVILYVGRFVERKGIDDLLEAFGRLDEPAELRLVGRGDTDAIRNRCRELDVGGSVTVDGEVPHLELPGYYAAADVFCLPSYTESFGMVNLEAMACGTPVVTSDLEAIEAYVTDGDEGLLLSPGGCDALTDALSRLVDAPARREAMGERARERARSFSWERQGKRLEAFCADVLDESLEQTRRERSTQLQYP